MSKKIPRDYEAEDNAERERRQIAEARCHNCKEQRQLHYLANYADGPHIGKTFLVCPSATFSESD